MSIMYSHCILIIQKDVWQIENEFRDTTKIGKEKKHTTMVRTQRLNVYIQDAFIGVLEDTKYGTS